MSGRFSMSQVKESLKSKRVRAGLVAAFVAFAIIGMRMHAASALRNSTEEQSVLTVNVIKAENSKAKEEVVLPGTVQAWHEAPIYARTNGYLKSWTKGMGSPVKEGDLLAEIETPEVDSQLKQAEADLATAKANNKLAQSTAKRWQGLLKTDSVSKQEADEKMGDAQAKEALVNSAQANMDRLKDLQSFKQVTAPFDGVITSRTTDIGALITSGSTTGQILFRIAQTEKLRIYVQVPQMYANLITPDLEADLYFPDHPDKAYPVKLFHSADAIEPVARTLLTEYLLDNKDGDLLPGGYVEAHMKIKPAENTIRLPVNTLLFRAEGSQVATLDENGKALLKPVKIGRDFGTEVEISSGVALGDTLIINPPDSLVTGQTVHVAVEKPKDEKAKDDKKS